MAETKANHKYPVISSDRLAALDKNTRPLLESGKYLQFFDYVIQNNILSPPILDLLPLFATTTDRAIHKMIQEIFDRHKFNGELRPLLVESKYSYVTTVGLTSPFIPESLKEEMCFTAQDEAYEHDSLNGKVLEAMQPFQFSLAVISRHAFHVEKRIILAHQLAEKIVPLDQVLKEFFSGLPFWSLGRFPNQFSVYGLYYFGAKPLYYSKVVGSKKRPIYIGVGTADIGEFLLILKDTNLPLKQFGVRVMYLDSFHYCSSLQSMLCEYFKPIWNSKQIGLTFSDAYDQEGVWFLYHIKKSQKIISTADNLVSKFYLENLEQYDNANAGANSGGCTQQ